MTQPQNSAVEKLFHEAIDLDPAARARLLTDAERTAVEAGEGSRLVLRAPGKRDKSVAAEHFVPRSAGQPGAAKGELVFVGYAAQWDEAQQAAMIANFRGAQGDDEGEGEGAEGA